MGIGLSAIDEYAVPGGQSVGNSVIYQNTGAGMHHKKQVRSQIRSLADVRLRGLQSADFLEMQQGQLGKIRRRVDDSGGVYQVAVK